MTAPTLTAATLGTMAGRDGRSTSTAPSSGPDVPIADVMARAVLAVTPDESLLLAWELLGRTGYHHLPVVDSAGHCVGMLESLDVARAMGDGRAVMDRVTVASLLPGRDRGPVVLDTATIGDAARVLARAGGHAVPVTDEAGRLVGIVTCHDIAAALIGEARRDVRPREPSAGLFRLVPATPDARA